MKHNIEIRTVESMVILNALEQYVKNRDNKIDIATACDVHKRIRDIVGEDLKKLKGESGNA